MVVKVAQLWNTSRRKVMLLKPATNFLSSMYSDKSPLHLGHSNWQSNAFWVHRKKYSFTGSSGA